MAWTNKKKIYGKNAHYSIAKKLRTEKNLTDEFETMFNSLNLEEVIALKLELAAKAAGSKLYGMPLWNSMQDIAKDAVLKYAISATRTKKEAAIFLGIDLRTFYKLQKEYNIENYFDK
jgi:DNA-binding NtrC family response regulator